MTATAMTAAGGRIALPGGHALDVRVGGPGAAARWIDGATGGAIDGATVGAIELHGPASADDDATLELELRHSLRDPRHVFVPHLTPDPGHVAGDAVFRSPAVLLADARVALALVPDLDDVARASGWRAWLDYDHPRSAVTLGAGAYRETGHVFFERLPAPPRASGVSLRLHVIASDAPRDLENPYGMAARWIWQRWGREGHARAGAAQPPVGRFMEYVVRWAFSREEGWADSVWQDVRFADGARAGAPVFIVDVTRHPSVPPEQRRWREPPSIWNQAWFSTQRCANGLWRYARQIRSADLEDRARRMTEVALAAPQVDGLFPAVLLKEARATQDEQATEREDRWRWSSSDRRPPSVSGEACHLVDAAFTCRMLLEWHALTGDDRALAFAVRFAERLCALQRPSGAFPGWLEPDGRIARELAEGPESAVSVALCFELGDRLAATAGAGAAGDAAGRATRGLDAHLRAAALAGLPFLEAVAREGRWEDFETYYSCAPWGADRAGSRVARNGVFKQNTLSMFWCAEAFLLAWRATGRAAWLDLARRCADELSLYQAAWSPAFLPAPAHGGFGVMNADNEWSDARASLFAPLYLELARETGDRELLERGVSAIRASFAMLYAPQNAAVARAYEKRFPFFGPESYGFAMENQGHGGGEAIGTFTIFTWGNGSALATVAAVRDRFPEVARDHGLA
jgi:hypothetical protein